MKPARFQYHAPTSTEEAVALLGEYGDEVKVLAGGQSLVPLLALRLTRFEHLVDCNRIDALARITAEPDAVSVGAMTRQSSAERSGEVAELAPLVSRAIPLIGHFQIRNRGTVGGSLSHADPSSELPAVACALDAELEVQSTRGTRRVAARDFFLSVFETALLPDELTIAVRFPRKAPHSGFAIEELAWRSGDFAVAGAAVAVRLDDSGRIDHARICLMGMGSTPIRAAAAEEALVGRTPEELADATLREIATDAAQATEPSDDVHASGEYRKRVAVGLVARALRSALVEASDG